MISLANGRSTAMFGDVPSISSPDPVVAGEDDALATLGRAGLPLAPSRTLRLTQPIDGATLAELEEWLAQGEGLSLHVRSRGPCWEGASPVRGCFDALDELEPFRQQTVRALERSEGGPEHCSLVLYAAPAAASGYAASADPELGDPDELHVWGREGNVSWRIDRRSARVTAPGEGLAAELAQQVADLADRAQLALGRPVEIEWVVDGRGRPALLGLRPLTLEPRFLPGIWRRLGLVEADEDVVAPLAIGALDLGLRPAGVGTKDRVVRRVYARPYRRRDAGSERLGRSEASPLAEAGRGVARATAQVTPLLERVLRYERARHSLLARVSSPLTEAMSDDALMARLRERQAAAAQAYGLLDQTRRATRNLLLALEAILGPLDAEVVVALAAPRAPSSRRRAEAALRRAALRFDSIPSSGAAREEWEALKRDYGHLRSLGIDVAPAAWGESDETLLRAMQQVPREAREARRHQAERVLLERARTMAFGPARAALVGALSLVLGRVARAKGGVSEVLAGVLLELRRAAVFTGARLEADAILDEPEDALLLHAEELVEALSGEPGAYAARVRLRREDDERWARYDPPRRIG